jgi:hypothetical protein
MLRKMPWRDPGSPKGDMLCEAIRIRREGAADRDREPVFSLKK